MNVRLRYGLKTVKCKALIDTGNTVTAKSVITKKLHNKIQSGFSEIGGKKIGTAKAGGQLTRIGRSKGIVMEIEGLKRKFKIKPTVVDDLSDDLNLGNGFLTSIGEEISCAIEYGEKTTKLRVGNEEVELIRVLQGHETARQQQACKAETETVVGPSPKVLVGQTNSTDLEVGPARNVNPGAESKDSLEAQAPTGTTSEVQAEPGTQQKSCRQARLKHTVQNRLHKQTKRDQEPERIRHVYCAEDMKVKKNTLTFVPAYLAKATDTGKDVMVEPIGNTSKTVGAVYKWKEKGNRIAVMNSFEYSYEIKKGSKIGQYTVLEERKANAEEEKVKEIKETTTNLPNVKELIKKLKIEENEILKSNPTVKEKVIELIAEYRDVFSDPEGQQIGTTDLVEFEVELQEGARPVRQKLRPLNPAQRDSLRKQLDTWTKEDVIEETNSPWASPLVPVRKKDGTTRWAVDYRAVNSVTVADSFPLPSIEENLEKLQGATIFSCVDAASAYNTIPVQQKSRPYLAFLTPWGTYTFKRMPFGAKNAGAAYSRLVELSIMKLRSPNVLAYVDDIIIATMDLMQHVIELEGVLEMHRIAGIKVKAEKTFIFQKEVDYLGFRVNEEGVNMKPSYVEKVLNWPTPTTIKELNTWLGFTSYYRSFIPNFSELTNEMNSMKKETKLVWNEILEEKFKKLKDEFSRMPVRSYPDYHSDEPFQIATDYSAENIAVVLSQVQDGQERFIAAAGRKTTKYERNYHSCKGELAAIVYALRKFEHLLRFKKFLIWTDSAALTYISSMKKIRGIYFRWLSEIQSFDFTIKHRPGKKNQNADALSRSNHLEPPTEEEEEEEAGYVHKLYNYLKELEKADGEVKSLHETGERLRKENIIREQKDDEILGQVRKWIKRNHLPDKQDIRDQPEALKVYYQNFEAFKIEDGILYQLIQLNSVADKQVHRICVPDSLQEVVHGWSHAHPSSGHFGIKATLQRSQQRFYYPGMKNDSETRVKACPECLTKIQRAKIRDATHQPRRTGYVGEMLFVDLVGPMPVGHDQNKYILTIEDAYSRYAMAIGIPNKEAATVAKHIMDRYVSIFGTPTAIHSDRGSEFTAEIFKHLMDRLQVKRTTTPAYNPQSNGNIERFHRTLNTLIRIFCDREDPEWMQYLSAATLAYNTKQHSSTGVTPFSGMFGRECRLPIDLIIPTPDDKNQDINVHVRETLERFKKMYGHIRKKNNAVIKRNAQLYSGKINDIKIGTRVWYLAPRKIQGKPTKITDAWIGPYKVKRKPTEVLVDIAPADYRGPTITTHMSRIMPCSTTATTKQRIPNKVQLNDQGDELAEEIKAPDNLEHSEELGVAVQFVRQPNNEILDLSRSAQLAQTEPAISSNIQTEPIEISEPGPSRQPTAPMDTRDRDRGTKRANYASDSEIEEKKQPRLRPRRNKEQLKEEMAKKRKRENTNTDDSEQQQKKPEQPFPLIPQGIAKYLPSDTAGESDSVDMLRTLEVDVATGSTMPCRATEGSAAYDITAHQTVQVPPHSTALVPLNLRLQCPKDHFLFLLSRSGLALRGIFVEGGVIDPDYSQEVKAIIKNSTNKQFKVIRGQRIAQAIFLPILTAKFNLVEKLKNEDGPSHEGFGSTDNQ